MASMHSDRRHVKCGVVFMVSCALLLEACASTPRSATSGSTTSSPTTSSIASSPLSTSSTAPTSTQPGSAKHVILTDKDKGTTASVHVGDRVTVVLGSTYWTFGTGTGSVLRSDGPTDVAPQTSGCVPGQGCGTATASFTAVAAGTTTIVATRTSCGEAARCTGATGSYEVKVSVS